MKFKSLYWVAAIAVIISSIGRTESLFGAEEDIAADSSSSESSNCNSGHAEALIPAIIQDVRNSQEAWLDTMNEPVLFVHETEIISYPYPTDGEIQLSEGQRQKVEFRAKFSVEDSEPVEQSVIDSIREFIPNPEGDLPYRTHTCPPSVKPDFGTSSCIGSFGFFRISRMRKMLQVATFERLTPTEPMLTCSPPVEDEIVVGVSSDGTDTYGLKNIL